MSANKGSAEDPLTYEDYILDLVDELIDVSVDYGRNQTPYNESALGEAADMLYKSIKKLFK